MTFGHKPPIVINHVGAPSLANMRNARSGPAEDIGKSSAASALQAEKYESRPTDMKRNETASLASLFRPKWCPIGKVPMNSHDRARNLMQKCGPIVKVHMNPYNRAAWQAARDVIKASLSAKVAPRPTSLPAGALGRSGGTRSSGTLPEALAAHKVSAAHTWRRPPPIMGKRRRVTWHSSTWPSPPLSRPSQLPSKVRKRLKSAKAAGSAENLENTASGPTPPEGFTGQLGDAAELRRLEEALAVGGHFIGHDQVARTFRNCPRIWHGFCGVRYQATEQRWRVKAMGDEKELPGRHRTLVAAATALAMHLGVEVPALGCGADGERAGGVGVGEGGKMRRQAEAAASSTEELPASAQGQAVATEELREQSALAREMIEGEDAVAAVADLEAA